MDLLNKKVKHKFNGEGIITNQNERFVYVCFDGKSETEKFFYPKVFLDGTMTILPLELNVIFKNELEKLGLDTSKINVNNGSKINDPQILRLAEERTVSAGTNAEFLNKVLNKNLNGFQQSGYKLSSNILLWMIRIDGKVHKGWKNTWLDQDTIFEEYVENDHSKETIVKEPYRIVAEIKENLFGRKYIIHGLFKNIKEESTSKKHLWKRDI